MDLQVLEHIIRLAEGSTLSVLELECDGLRVRCEKPASITSVAYTKATAPINAPVSVFRPNAPATVEPAAAEEPEGFHAPAQVGSKELKSPMVGTFHFLKGKEDLIGKRFKKGEPVCTIEAMKLMNEIGMEEDGEIAWLAVAEGDMVEYGQLLLTFE